MKGPLFYAKILLFGEYGIIKNSKGLSIPYAFYKGGLKIPTGDESNPEIEKSHKRLKEFAKYLKSISTDIVSFNWKLFASDLSKKMYFDSSIPEGYGVGSSGALVASIYDKYAIDKITIMENMTKEKLQTLKNIFATMENFFHGSSSGLDPLNSYLSLPILIHSKDHVETTGIPHQNVKGKSAIFLLNSGINKKTSSMVSIFMENMKNSQYQHMMKNKFIKFTDSCIQHFLSGDMKSLFVNLKQLSNVVLEHFKPMIPKNYVALWEQGIKTNSYYLKLCGSGGGGYILGFTENIEKAKELLKDKNIEVVYQF